MPNPGPATGNPGVFKAQSPSPCHFLTPLPPYPFFRKDTVKYMRKALVGGRHDPSMASFPSMLPLPGPTTKAPEGGRYREKENVCS